MDHDGLFKRLLQTFFAEFLDLFLPEVAESVRLEGVEFLDKELLTDPPAGERREVDLLAKCRFRDRAAYVLVHVETQAAARADFAERMFRYFALLTLRHRLPVYPVALFTYGDPSRPEADRYELAVAGLDVLAFRFRAIQLNRLDWRAFAARPNPVAAALMTKMRIDPADRPRVKLECVRLLATLKLDPVRRGLIRDFVDAYLRLNDAEMARYDVEVGTIESPEREAVMQIVNEWESRGEARGKAKIVLRLLRRKFGELPASLLGRVESLPEGRVEALGEALLDFTGLSDAERWLATADVP